LVINIFEKNISMQRSLFLLGIIALLTTGCNNSGTAGADKDVKKNEQKAAAVMLKDISTAKDIKTLLAQNWENKDDAQEAALSGGGGAFEMPYRGFSFFTDGTVVQDPRDNIRFGKWEVDEAGKLLTITYANGSKAQYTIESIAAKDMVLMSKGEKKKVEYKADGKVHKDAANDPFYGRNNQWRIKPLATETDEAVKQRLLDCLAFNFKFLNDNIERDAKTVSFIGFPTIFKWYSGGVSIIPKNKVEPKWIACFYNEAQALKAQEMMENIITRKYKWDKNETSWLKQDADGVRQIADTLAAAPISVLLAK
jgi:hypothetical protein